MIVSHYVEIFKEIKSDSQCQVMRCNEKKEKNLKIRITAAHQKFFSCTVCVELICTQQTVLSQESALTHEICVLVWMLIKESRWKLKAKKKEEKGI